MITLLLEAQRIWVSADSKELLKIAKDPDVAVALVLIPSWPFRLRTPHTSSGIIDIEIEVLGDLSLTETRRRRIEVQITPVELLLHRTEPDEQRIFKLRRKKGTQEAQIAALNR